MSAKKSAPADETLFAALRGDIENQIEKINETDRANEVDPELTGPRAAGWVNFIMKCALDSLRLHGGVTYDQAQRLNARLRRNLNRDAFGEMQSILMRPGTQNLRNLKDLEAVLPKTLALLPSRN